MSASGMNQTAQLRQVLEPLKAHLTQKEKELVEAYNPDQFESSFRIKSKHKYDYYNVPDFACPSQETKTFLKGGDVLAWSSYSRLADEIMIDDLALVFFQKYMLHLIPAELKEGVHFVNANCTADMTGANNMELPLFTKQSMRPYYRFFGKNNKFSALKKVFFPFHVEKIHYVGAIANKSASTVYTFDSFGEGTPAHEYVFGLVCRLLNDALKLEGEKAIEWKHVRVKVPAQKDGINCGLFRTVNGLILTAVDDPTSAAVYDILFNQDEIERVRTKLMGLILGKSELRYQPKQLHAIFAEAKQLLEDTAKRHAIEQRRIAFNLKLDQGSDERGAINLAAEDSDDDEAQKPSSKRVVKPSSTTSTVSSKPSEKRVVKPLSTTSTVSSKPSAKRVVKPSSMTSTASSSGGIMSNELCLALQSPSPVSIHFSDGVKAEGLAEIVARCDMGEIFGGALKKIEEIASDEDAISQCFNNGKKTDVKKFKKELAMFCNFLSKHCQQVLCLRDMSQQIWAHLGNALKEESFRKVFSGYLLDTLTSLKRASTILDNGTSIVKKDANVCPFFVDLILQTDKDKSLRHRYKSINSGLARQKGKGRIGGFIAFCHDIIHGTIKTVVDDLPGSVNGIFVNTAKGILSVSYLRESGQEVAFEDKLHSLNVEEFNNSQHHSYPLLDLYDFRMNQLQKLFKRCNAAKVKVPDILCSALQQQFDISNEGKKVAADLLMAFNQRRVKRKRIAYSSSDDDSVEGTEESTHKRLKTSVEELKEETEENSVPNQIRGGGIAGNETVEEAQDDTDEKAKLPEGNADDSEKNATVETLQADEDATHKNASKPPGGNADDSEKSVNKEDASGVASQEKKRASADEDTTRNNASNPPGGNADDTSEKIVDKEDASGGASQEKKRASAEGFTLPEKAAEKKAEKSLDKGDASGVASQEKKRASAEGSTLLEKAAEKKADIAYQKRQSLLPFKRKRKLVQGMGDKHIKCQFLNASKTPTKRTTTVEEKIAYKQTGSFKLDGSSSLNVHVDMDMIGGAQALLHDKDVTVQIADDLEKNQNQPTVFQQRARGDVDIFQKIAPTCALLRKNVQRKDKVLRDSDKSVFKNSHCCPAEPFIIDGIDPIEVIDHVRSNTATCKLLVRVAFPADEEHDLIKTLKRQFDLQTYQSMVEVAKKHEDLILIAFTTMYMNDLAGHQQSVDELIFHSLILMKRPGSTFEKDIFVPFKWTSHVFNGALLDRLLQIACLLFWNTNQNLIIRFAGKSRSRLQWKSCNESVVDIAARVLHGAEYPFALKRNMQQFVSKSTEKTNRWTSNMIPNLEKLLLPSVAQNASKEIPRHLLTIESPVQIPLAFFTHWLCRQKQYFTEIGAELLQIASIVPITTTVRSVTTNNDDGGEMREWEEWKFHLRCCCCGMSMNTPVDLVSLMSLGTRIIIHHYFGAGDIDLHQYLGEIRTNDIPRGFKINPCVPPEEASSGSVLSQSTLRRMNFCDAIKIDNAQESGRLQNLLCNTLGLTAALLPTNVTEDTLDKFPLVKALSEMVQKLLDSVVDTDDLAGASSDDAIQDLKCVMKGRPIQVQLTDISVDPISSLKPHASWNRSELEEKPPSSTRQDFAKPKKTKKFKVGGLEVEGGAITAYTPRTGQGNSVLFMLSFYYASCLTVIEPGMTFDQLKASVGGNITVPSELEDFMNVYAITTRTLVVITDCPKSAKKKGHQSRLDELTKDMRSNLSWFLPTDFFLHLLPKNEVEKLQSGRLKVLQISKETRKRLKDPIKQSLKFEIKSLRLYSSCPNKILEVTLSNGGNAIYIDASDVNQECLWSIQERWLLEPLSSLLHVSGPLVVNIGIGKKKAIQGGQRVMSDSVKGPNFWYDQRNKYNLCVAGAIVNWLHAEGLQNEASMMKKWAESQNMFALDHGAMTKSLIYLRSQFRIENVVINFLKPKLTIQDAVTFHSDFPAPTILEFKSLSSHQTHSIVVSNKVVYDIQDMHAYDLNKSSLVNHLNGDSDGVSLVSARYFIVPKSDKISIESCPSQQIKHDNSTTHGKLIRSFGDKKERKRSKRKRASS